MNHFNVCNWNYAVAFNTGNNQKLHEMHKGNTFKKKIFLDLFFVISKGPKASLVEKKKKETFLVSNFMKI